MPLSTHIPVSASRRVFAHRTSAPQVRSIFAGLAVLLAALLVSMSEGPAASGASVLGVSGADLSVLSAKAPPFKQCAHPWKPSNFFSEALRSKGHALPTNRWWQNCVLGTGDNAIVAYPYSLRLSSPGSPLHSEASATQSATSLLVDPLSLTQVGVYASLPAKEASPTQVIMPWKPDLLLTTTRFNLEGAGSAPTPAAGSGTEPAADAGAQPTDNDTKHDGEHTDAPSKHNVSTSAVKRAPSPPPGIKLGEQSAIQAEALATKMGAHEVVAEDLLSLRVQWNEQGGKGRMQFPIVRGSPFLTGIYSGLCPALYTGHAILSVNEETIPGASSEHGSCSAPNNRHELTLNSGVSVLVYLDRPACVSWDRNRVVFQDTEGKSCAASEYVMRVAMLPANLPAEVQRNRVAILDAFRASVPLAGSVNFARDGNDNAGGASTMRFAWRAVDLSKQGLRLAPGSGSELEVAPVAKQLDGQGLDSSDLLMLSLPHQTATLKNSHPVGLEYDSIKGTLSATVGTEWKMHLRHAPISWFAQTRTLEQAKPEWREAIAKALRADAAGPAGNITDEVKDPYGFGKEISRMARLVLVADELGGSEFTALAKSLRTKMKGFLKPWFAGSNADPLQFDTVWGGMVPAQGIKDFNADFGAGAYNDHHFHFGYFIYGMAVVAKEDRSFAQEHREAMLSFVRDIANPGTSAAGPDHGEGLEAPFPHSAGSAADPFFPTFRHTDVFDGHSWANGLFSGPNGRNSESSSEALNAYHAIALLGRALGDSSVEYLGEVLTSIELQGVKRYWHMRTDKSAFPPVFSANKCVGMLWSDKVVVETWFAVGLAYVHAINLIPITPLSEAILTPAWVAEQYPVLEKALPQSSPRMDDPWMGFAHADLAVLDPEEAWRRTEGLKHFDNGNSRTNMLYWIATRPK